MDAAVYRHHLAASIWTLTEYSETRKRTTMRHANTTSGRDRATGLSHRLLTFAVWWAILFGVWLVLVDSLAHPEVAGGAIAAFPAAFITYGVVTTKDGRFRVHPRWLLALRSVPGAVLRDSALLVPILWRRVSRGELPPSSFLAVGTAMAGDEPEAATQRALSIFGTSLAPNTFVIGIDQERGVALVHQLVPRSPEQVRNDIVSAAPNSRGG